MKITQKHLKNGLIVRKGNKMWVAITKDGDILAQHSDMKTGYQYVYTIAFQEKIWFNIIWRD